jgi:magnesium transporter
MQPEGRCIVMPRFFKRVSKKGGLSPGTLVHIGKKKMEKVRIRLINYDEAQLQEKEPKTIEECFPFKDLPTVTWVKIDGLHNIKVVEKPGKHFDLHPLVLEDIRNTEKRSEIEDLDE